MSASFLGKGWSFPPVFSKRNKKLLMVSEDEDIIESLRILLSTTPGERIIQPEFGCNIRSLIFEEFTLSAQTLAKENIYNAILNFESRIIVNSVDFDISDKGCIQININYTVRSTNTRFNMVYPYYLNEGTGIKS